MKTMKTLAEVKAEIANLAQAMEDRAVAQYNYSIKENIPRGILKPEEVGDNAVRTGIVAALTQKHEWDISLLQELCADILEDANDHETAAELRAKAQAEVA